MNDEYYQYMHHFLYYTNVIFIDFQYYLFQIFYYFLDLILLTPNF